MKREIKFRGKNAKGEWVFGSLIVSEIENDKGKFKVAFIAPELPFVSDGGDYYTTKVERVKIETICQFTGLHDNEGKEIYEGDIIGVKAKNEEMILHVVFYEDSEGRFKAGLNGTQNRYDFGCCGLEDRQWTHSKMILGNIYDNPELLKK